MYTHIKQIQTAGQPVSSAKKAVIMVHGRGASAGSILNLASHLELGDAAIIAPQATNSSWYPYGFMSPSSSNQPALDSALALIDEIVADLISAGITRDRIYWAGFSQGACLSLEYTARNTARYGGVIAFTGGLIGEKLHFENYNGSFQGTPFLVTTGDPDPHVPLSRVEESIRVLEQLDATMTLKVFKGRPHTIIPEEIKLANELLADISN